MTVHPADVAPARSTDAPVPRVPRGEVRRRVLDAAARVFAERGYGETRLEDVAREAGFTKGAVYSNFSGKHELFATLLTEHVGMDRERMETEVAALDSVEAATTRAASLLVDRLVRDARWHQLVLEFAARAGRDGRVRAVYAPLRRRHRQALARLLAAHAERLGVRLRVPAEEAAVIMMALRNGLALEHGIDPDAMTSPRMARATASVMAGLITSREEDS